MVLKKLDFLNFFFLTFTRFLSLEIVFQVTYNFPPEAFSADKWSSHAEFQENKDAYWEI